MKILIFLFSIYCTSVFSKGRILYFQKDFGHVHKNSTQYSAALTTISCSHPVELLKADKKWTKVKVGPYHGYIKTAFLGAKRKKCFQDKYPRFFEAMELDVNDYYYWGQLYGQYIIGKSKVKK